MVCSLGFHWPWTPVLIKCLACKILKETSNLSQSNVIRIRGRQTVDPRIPLIGWNYSHAISLHYYRMYQLEEVVVQMNVHPSWMEEPKHKETTSFVHTEKHRFEKFSQRKQSRHTHDRRVSTKRLWDMGHMDDRIGVLYLWTGEEATWLSDQQKKGQCETGEADSMSCERELLRLPFDEVQGTSTTLIVLV